MRATTYNVQLTDARSTLRDTFWVLAIFAISLFVYQSNGDTYLYAYDSAPNSLLAFNLLDNHRLDFDNFRDSYFSNFGANYIFIEGRGGKLASLFPIGTAIITAPLYAEIVKGFDTSISEKLVSN